MYVYPIKDKQIFLAGKVHLFSDFDGTYFPKRQSTVIKNDIIPDLTEYCEKMDSFFKATEGDIDFHITTGRNFGEYETICEILRDKNFKLPLPETLISKEGSDEFIKTGTDYEFYTNKKFPFESEKINQNKYDEIKRLTNWDGVKIKEHMRELAKIAGIEFIEGDTQHSRKIYGKRSLYSAGKLEKDEWMKLPQKDGIFKQHKQPVVSLKVGSKNMGNLKIKLFFPPDYDYCEERTKKYNDFVKDIENFLDKNGVKYIIKWKNADKASHYRKRCIIVPNVDKFGLTKVYDTKVALRKAAKEKDFVVVAGNDFNDFDMLNPLNYIDKEKWEVWEKHSSNKEFYQSKMSKKLEDLKAVYNNETTPYISSLRAEFQQNGLLKEIEQLPLCGIVVENENSSLKNLVNTFKSTGKIIEIPKGELDKGIRTAIKNYGNSNLDFKNAMSKKFNNFIYSTKIQQKSNKKKYKPLLIISVIGCIAGIVGSLISKKQNNKE